MNHSKTDIIVIGGGIIGLSIAYFSACQGASVILVEKNRTPSGTSYGNAGLIVPSHCEPLPGPKVIREGIRQLFDSTGAFSIRLQPDPEMILWLLRFCCYCNTKHFFRSVEIYKALGQASLQLHTDFAKQGGSVYEYDQTGLLHLYVSTKAFRKSREDASRMEDYGIKSRILSGDEVRNLDPSIGTQVLGAVQHSIDGRLNPLTFMEWLTREAKNKGVDLKTGTEVFGFEKTRRQIEKIYTTRGSFRGDQVVLATGAWTALLSKKLGLRLPIQGAKGYSLTFRRPPNSPRIPIILQESHIAMTPLEQSFRITGALELSGLDGGIDLKRIKTIQYHANTYVPQLKKMDLIEIWRGFRPCTPDGLPMIGKAESFNNLWIASGHSTKGMTLGPVTGKLMGAMLAGKSIGPIAQALSVNRF